MSNDNEALDNLDKLSDDDFANKSDEELLALAGLNTDDGNDGNTDDGSTDDTSDDGTETDDGSEDGNTEDTIESAEEIESADGDGEKVEDTVIEPEEPSEEGTEGNTEDIKLEEPEPKGLTLEEALEPLTYKGSKVPINDIEELRSLASKGLDYTNKTMALSSDKRYLDALKKEDLLDDSKFNLMVAAAKGDKEAILELMKVNNIEADDLPFDEENAKTYVPESKVTSAEAAQIQQVLGEIKEVVRPETYNHLFDEVDNSFDEATREYVLANPSNLKILSQHMDQGYYGIIKAEIAKRRALGTVDPHMPFLNLYQLVGHELEQAGMFANQEVKPANTDKKQKNSSMNNAKKRIVSPTRSSAKKPVTSLTLEDLDNLSDDAFLEQFENMEF